MWHMLSKRDSQIMVSIEMLLDLKTLMVKDLVRHLKAAKYRFETDSINEKTR